MEKIDNVKYCKKEYSEKKKKILVLMSTYNGERYLREQIDSILLQNGVEVSLLVRDDGSSDSTFEILKRSERTNRNVKLCVGENVGCSESFRILLNMAYGLQESYDFYAFADQDDVWLPEKLYAAAEKLNESRKTIPSLYCSNLKVVDTNLNEIGMKYNQNLKLVTKGESLVCSMATGCTMVFNHKVLEIFNLYPPKQMIIHDLWILHTCLFLGEVIYDNNAYILYRQHDRNVIGAKITFSSQVKTKMKSISHLFSEHDNEKEAKELIHCYSSLFEPYDLAQIKVLADYKKSLSNWWRFLMGRDKQAREIHRQHNNWILKIRILLGCV